MASSKRLIPTTARVLVAVSLGVAIGAAAAAPFLTIYKYDDAGNIVRVSSTASDPENCGDRDKVCSSNHLAARACQNGSCGAGVCEAGWGDCDGNMQSTGCETSTMTTSNCGGCGRACSTSHVLTGNPWFTCSATPQGPQCAGLCWAGWGNCNGDMQSDGCETDTRYSVAHCGGCGVACSIDHITPECSSGSCSSGVCTAGWDDCNGNKLVDGCETPLNTKDNCGGCGIACSSNHVSPVCSVGYCSGDCATGWDDCNWNKQTDGCETDITVSRNHCGGCGMACSSNNITPACLGGRCDTGVCQSTSFYQGNVLITLAYADCNGNKRIDGCETDISNDRNNCGGCGIVCSSNHVTPACSPGGAFGGSCTGTCEAGWADCNGNKRADGCETAITTTANCGTCGRVCSSNHIAAACSGGSCEGAVCAAGWADCNNSKQLDGCETSIQSNINCGGCGVRCAAGRACINEECVATSCTPRVCRPPLYWDPDACACTQ